MVLAIAAVRGPGAAVEMRPQCATGSTTIVAMTVTAKKLDVSVGDVVEIEGRKYDVVSDKHGGVTLEPAITRTADEIFGEHGLRPLTPEEFEEEFGHVPSDGEG
jgi:hypothetical protein